MIDKWNCSVALDIQRYVHPCLHVLSLFVCLFGQQEKELKAAADSTLQEVERKLADVSKFEEVLKSLTKLRHVRKEKLIQKGKICSSRLRIICKVVRSISIHTQIAKSVLHKF